ncbi:MAG: NAD(P)/FAD-dependent oxidoreductase [Kofleriaceae bacterium]
MRRDGSLDAVSCAQAARAPRRSSPVPRTGWSRRDFLGAGRGSTLPLVGCGDNIGPAAPRTIAIVGGIAGLTAAHYLARSGVRAELYEGSMRAGGRMWTQRGLPGNQLVELGGELVDTDHVVIPRLASRYGLQLDDLIDDTASLKQDTFLFNTVVQNEATIVAAFRPVAMQMALNVAASEGTDPASVTEFERIDAMSIPEWLTMEAGLPANAMIKELLEIAYLEEYGIEAAMQSAWNMIYLIDHETPDPFRVFGDSDERFHIHEGSDALTTALADDLESGQLHLDHRLTKVAMVADRYELTFDVSGTPVSVFADHVVYALPFTKLREVDLTASGLSEDKLDVITNLGYGTNAKLMLQFTDRHWETTQMSAGGAITDVGELQTIWATSRGQDGIQGILTNFVGGNRGLTIGEGTPESQAQQVLPWINTVFPGTAAKYVPNSAIRMHWPSYEFTKGSYAGYLVGQWKYFGTEGAREGNQHFCGEHCSEDYQGYMEGGAETGLLVAAEILDDLRATKPFELVEQLKLVASRPRASYHAGFGERMRLGEIRRRDSRY